MKLCKKAVSFLLALCMMLTLLPVSALAADENDTGTDIPELEIRFDTDQMKAFSDQTGTFEEMPVSTGDLSPIPNGDKTAEGEYQPVLSDEGKGIEPAADVDQSPNEDPAACGDHLTWSLDDGTLTISGTGAMYDYEWQVDEELQEYLDAPWFDMRDEITKIVVMEGVTAIGANAFAACLNAADVSVAKSVTDIGEGAFDGCGAAIDLEEAENSNSAVILADDPSGNVRYSVLVLDISGSMSGRPITAQKAAAIKFCDSLLKADGSNYVAIVSFSSSVRVVSEFSNDINVLTKEINKISAYGSTYTIGGLEKAGQMLSTIPSTAGRSIVLCSDGLPNEGARSQIGPFTSADGSSYAYANAVHNKSVELMQNYDVFTLGFFHRLSGKTLEFTRKFMEAIQNAGYYEVNDPDDLEFTFGDIAGDVVTPGHSGILIVPIPKDKYVFHVVSSAGRNLRGVNVTCNDSSAETNQYGLAFFDRKHFVSTPKVMATASGYIDWSNESSNWTMDTKGYATIVMYPTAEGKYKLSECTYSNNEDMSNGTNLLTRTKTVSLGNDLALAPDLDNGDFYITCKATDSVNVKQYELWQGNTQISTSNDGKFCLEMDKTGYPFVEGGKCVIRVIANDGTLVATNINLQFVKCEINKNTELSFSGGKDDSPLSFKVADDIPFLGGSTFEFELPGTIPIHFEYSPDGRKIQIGINLKKEKNFKPGSGDNKDDKDETPYDLLKKMLGKKQDEFTKEQLDAFEKLQEKNNEFGFLKKGKLDVLGYIEGDVSAQTLKGHIMFKGTIDLFKMSYTAWCVIVPVTAQIDASAGAKLIGEIGYDWKNAQWFGSAELGGFGELKAFGGVGVGRAVGAGAYGDAKLEGSAIIIGTPWGLKSVTLEGELGLKAYLAWFTYERPFAKNKWSIYTANTVKALADEGDSYEAALFGMYDAGNYQKHDLGYLSEESEWIGTPIALFDASAGTNLAALVENTYRDARPVMIATDNAMYATFLKADQANNNIYAAVTKYNGTAWEEPKRVDNSAVMDGAPSLCADKDGNVWLAYSQTAPGHSLTSLADYAKNQSIVVGKINPDTLALEEKKVYPGSGYAHLQQLSAVNGVPTLVWADSPVTDEDSVLWPASADLYTASCANGTWSEAQKQASVSKPVLQVVAGNNVVAYVADEDGSVQTTEDQSLYSTDNNAAIASNVQGKVVYDKLPGQAAADFIWNTEGGLKTASGTEIPAAGMTREYSIAGNRIYYSAAGETGAHLTTVIYDTDWSAPITLTGGDRYLENISVVRQNNSDYVMGMDTLADITEDEVSDSKNLVWAKVQPVSDLRLDDISYDADGLTAGVSVPVTLTVVNAGDHPVTNIEISVESTQESRTCSINPGESAEIKVDVTCPTQLNMYSFGVKENGMDDFTPENNTKTVGIGYADLDVKVEEERINSKSSLIVIVTNKGVATASGTVSVSGDSGNILKNTDFTDLEPGAIFVVSYPIKDNGVYTASAALANDEEDLYTYNNSDTTRVGELPEPTGYTITFDANGGSVTPAVMTTQSNGKLASLPTATHSGRYSFDGWYSLPSGGTRITTDTVFIEDTTVYAQWIRRRRSNSSSSRETETKNDVSVSGGLTHGSVSVSLRSAAEGTTVTITAKPDEGYKLDSLEVTDENGSNLKITDKGDGKYTFSMSDSDVEIDADFIMAEEIPESQKDLFAANTMPYTDISASDPNYEAVRYVYEKGIMTGTSNTAFSPNVVISRGMIVSILHRLEKEPTALGKIFPDVAVGSWYENAVAWASANGIVSGYSDGRFGPDDTITKEQLLSILNRYAQYKGYNASGRADISAYQDADGVSSYALEAVQWAVSQSLMSDTQRLNAPSQVTRVQAADILTRFCQNVAK